MFSKKIKKLPIDYRLINQSLETPLQEIINSWTSRKKDWTFIEKINGCCNPMGDAYLHKHYNLTDSTTKLSIQIDFYNRREACILLFIGEKEIILKDQQKLIKPFLKHLKILREDHYFLEKEKAEERLRVDTALLTGLYRDTGEMK